MRQSLTTRAELVWTDSPRDPYGSLEGQSPLDAWLGQKRTELLAMQNSGGQESTTSS